MADLNSTTLVPGLGGWTLQFAMNISDNGNHIVGFGTNAKGQTDAFLLTATLPGDANVDGKVDINDLTIVLANYGKTGMTWTQGEFTGTALVDINDLTIVLRTMAKAWAAGAARNRLACPSATCRKRPWWPGPARRCRRIRK